MKRTLSRILVVALVASLAALVACGDKSSTPKEGDMENAGKEAGKAADDAAAKTDAAAKETGKALEDLGK